MHLLYCDESNMEEKSGDFLVYAGVSIPPETALRLSEDIERVRKRNRVPADFHLKFNPGPPKLSHSDFISLKEEVLKKAAEHGARLFAYVVLHDIAKDKDEARRNGINTVLYHFDCFLNRKNDQGLVLLDRFNDRGNRIDEHTREKMSVGLVGLPYSPQRPLEHILGVHYSTIGQSHFCSLVDIVVGSLRFALNVHTRNQIEYQSTAGTLLKLLSPLFFREENEGWSQSDKVSELGFLFSPKAVTAPRYRAKYEALKAFMAEHGVDTAQPIREIAHY